MRLPNSVVTALTIGLLLASHAPAAAQPEIAGNWVSPAGAGLNFFEDQVELAQGPPLVDFAGIPWNEAGRARALSYDGSLLTVPEHQCMPHPLPYSTRAPGLRISAELNENLQVVAYHIGGTFRRADITIWMDGRPHPPEYAPHRWAGFTTGRWSGNTLIAQTTHLKWGWLRRNGAITSDQATMTLFFTRQDDLLTLTTMVHDPLYLTESYVKTTDFRLGQPPVAVFGAPVIVQQGGGLGPSFFKCYGTEEVARDEEHFVPHYLPWANPFVQEFADKWKLPPGAALGGAETALPEYRDRLK